MSLLQTGDPVPAEVVVPLVVDGQSTEIRFTALFQPRTRSMMNRQQRDGRNLMNRSRQIALRLDGLVKRIDSEEVPDEVLEEADRLTAELQALQEKQMDVLREQLVGWEGLTGQGGQAVEYAPEVLEEMLDSVPYMLALTAAMLGRSEEAEKNSLTPDAGGRPAANGKDGEPAVSPLN